MAAATLQRQRLERIEQELWALATLVDGRHARDGMITWATIRCGVEDCWRRVRAVLDDAPAGTEDMFEPPSRKTNRLLGDLETIAAAVDELRFKVDACRRRV